MDSNAHTKLPSPRNGCDSSTEGKSGIEEADAAVKGEVQLLIDISESVLAGRSSEPVGAMAYSLYKPGRYWKDTD